MGLESALASGTANYFASRRTARAAQDAANLQAQVSREATEEQRRQYNQSREDLMPWMESGRAALGSLDRAAGGDMSEFSASPDYEFRRSEGQRNIGNMFSARGSAASGNALRALTQYNQDLASGEFGNWWNRTAARAGVGQSAVNQSSALGANAANQIGAINQNAAGAIGNNWLIGANARASGIMNTNQAFQDANRNTMNYLGYFMGGWGG